MNMLKPQELERFSKLLGMLGSDQLGERAAAAAKATEFLAARNLTWRELAQMIAAPPVIRQHKASPQGGIHQTHARTCLESGIIWGEREEEFLTDMVARAWPLTEKQQKWLDALSARAAAHQERSSCEF